METIGFLELNSIAKGMEVADCVLKTAEVKLVFSRAGCPATCAMPMMAVGCVSSGRCRSGTGKFRGTMQTSSP